MKDAGRCKCSISQAASLLEGPHTGVSSLPEIDTRPPHKPQTRAARRTTYESATCMHGPLQTTVSARASPFYSALPGAMARPLLLAACYVRYGTITLGLPPSATLCFLHSSTTRCGDPNNAPAVAFSGAISQRASLVGLNHVFIICYFSLVFI